MPVFSEGGNEVEERRKFLSSVVYGGSHVGDILQQFTISNTVRYNCPVSGTYICIFRGMNHLMLKLKTSENLGNFGRCKVMSVGLSRLPFSVHGTSMGMLVESSWDFSKTKSFVIMSLINLGLH